MKVIFSFALGISFIQVLASQPTLQWSPQLLSKERATVRYNFYGLPAYDPNKWLLPADLPGDFPVHISPVPVAFQQYEQPFFCRLEYKMERKIKVPVRLRLGEVQYVDMLEGKSNYDSWMRTIGTAMNFIVDKRGSRYQPFWQQ